jgi:hypothetical protein
LVFHSRGLDKPPPYKLLFSYHLKCFLKGDESMNENINLSEWYSATAAAERLSRNSGKPISSSYPRKLAEYGRVRTLKISERNVLYKKEDIDPYIVEERGEKSARAKRQSARPKTRRDRPTKNAA